MNEKTIHTPSPAGTHPSHRSPGLHSYDCDECGAEVRYTELLGEDYVWNSEKVGYRDIDSHENLCCDCEVKRFGKA